MFDIEKIGLDLRVAMFESDYEENEADNSDKVNTWELIVRYNENWLEVVEKLDVVFVELLAGFGIIYLDEKSVEMIAEYKEILFIDIPKKMVLEQYKKYICPHTCLGYGNYGKHGTYTGKDVYIGIIDSGIDIYHNEFINGNETVISRLWNQSLDGNPPIGYYKGYEYNQDDINEMIDKPVNNWMDYDISGHGTAVASIAHGCAYDAKLVVVKLDNRKDGVNTADLMMAIDYCVRISIRDNVPIVLNLSFGNNYGDHSGNSILEKYIDAVSGLTRCGIVVGSGNEGDSSKHSEIFVDSYGRERVTIIVDKYVEKFSIQIWRNLLWEIDIYLETPDGNRIGPVNNTNVNKYDIANIRIVSVESTPSPINKNSEVYINIESSEGYIIEGEYKIVIENKSDVSEKIYFWLPVSDNISSNVYFEMPELSTTLTIPSTANSVITVGAYDGTFNTYASFSGRGYTMDNRIKPDVVAPGVNVLAAVSGGGYGYFTGTSFATPVVTGIAARLMEYGITDGNNINLYGEALRGEIIRNTTGLEGIKFYPDNRVGYGIACTWPN